MILGRLEELAHWKGVHPMLLRGLVFLRDTDLASLDLGRHAIDGERLFAIVDRYETRPPDRCRLEAHRRYHDIQFIAEGRERIGYAAVASVREAVAYDVEKDIAFFEGAYESLTLHAGDLAIFAPHDAHAPQMMIDAPQQVRKVVLKVELPT